MKPIVCVLAVLLFVSCSKLGDILPSGGDTFKVDGRKIEITGSYSSDYVGASCINSSANGAFSVDGNDPQTGNEISATFLNLTNLSGKNTLKVFSSSSCSPWGALFIYDSNGDVEDIYDFPSGTVLDLSNGKFSVAKTMVENYDGDQMEVTLKGTIQSSKLPNDNSFQFRIDKVTAIHKEKSVY